MSTDLIARQKLLDRQREQSFNSKLDDIARKIPSQQPAPQVVVAPSPETKALTEKIGQLTDTISKQQVVQQKVVSPAESLANELRALQRVIGSGSLIDSLTELSKGLNSFELNTDAVTNLRNLVTDLTTKVKLLAELEAKIPTEIRVKLKEELDGMQVSGKVNVGTIDKLPPLQVSNLGEIGSLINGLSNSIRALQEATVKAVIASKPEMPKGFEVTNVVEIQNFGDLLEAMEELKKGLNLLINKEGAGPDSTSKVEVTNFPVQKIPTPVTHISINGLQGSALATAVTVTTSATALPTTALTNRRSLVVYNNSSVTVFIGGSSVTTSNGMPIAAGTYSPAIDASPGLVIYGIVASSTADMRVLELSDINSGA